MFNLEHKMGKIYLTLCFGVTLVFYSCVDRKESLKTNLSQPQEIENINVIFDNSGSMSGYLNGRQFKKTITDFIADLDKFKSDKKDNLQIKNLSYFTFSDNLKLNRFSGDAYSFCSAINNKGLAIGRTSPMDDFVKLLVDSSKQNTIDILISDFVIDKKIKNIQSFIQSEFTIIFNAAKQKNLGLLIYRLTSDFTGTYFPATGSSYPVPKPILRPYFIWLMGPAEQLNLLREKIQRSKVFAPENEISFGLLFKPKNVEVLKLSNRKGSWRFRNEQFVDADLSKGNLKFTLALNLEDFPSYITNPTTLNERIVATSSSLEISSRKFYTKEGFISKYHKKEKQNWIDNTHFLEINISQINASRNELFIGLNKTEQDWYKKLSTDHDSSLKDGNNLNTYMLNYIISGIANAYGELQSNEHYFTLNYIINK